MKKLVMVFIIVLLSSFASARWFEPEAPPPVLNFCSVFGCNMSGDIDMNYNYIWNALLFNVTLVNSTVDITTVVNSTQVTNPPWLNSTDGNYLYDIDYKVYFNDSKLNQTILDVAGGIGTTDIWVNETGDTMTGNLNMSGNNISGVNYLDFFTPNDKTYFRYNVTNGTLELWVNGEIQQDWGASTTVYQEATFLDSIFGDGSTLLNVCLPSGLTVSGDPCNATQIFTTDELWILNIGGVVTFNESKFNESVNGLTNTSHSVGAGPLLYNVFDGSKTNIYINESVLEETIDNRTGIFEVNFSVNIASGVGTNSTTFAFPRLAEILDVTVTPTTLTNSYRFSANGTITGTVVDTNRRQHVGEWHVGHRGVLIQGENISAYITQASIDENFIVKFRYRQ